MVDSVVEHVPGGSYARDKLSDGIDKLEDTTGRVVELVPGKIPTALLEC